jgi:two-component system cell cycle sensor histidine kinase/response regulator CckA
LTLRHPQLEFGLVSCGASEPRQWREHEIAILTDMAEYLALAIRQAHAQQEHAGMERQLRDSQKMEAVGRLVGGIAHDFNNLLTAMMIYCGLLSTSLGKAHRLYGHVDQIRQAGERGANLVAQLLALTKQQVLEPRIVTISTVVEDMRDMLQRVIGEDVVLLTGCSPDLCSTRVDAAQLEQVILNMAINARDAMPDGGQLSIDCSNVELDDDGAVEHQIPAGPYVQLRIADTGQGMDDATMARIFDPFFTTKGQGKGTGLGLSTAYGIIKQHGGNISVISELGSGTSFTVLLPALAAPADSASQTEHESQPNVAFGGETVLLVEDEALVRFSLVETLRGSGYNVLEAACGEEAIALSDQYAGQIPLMVTDLVMPGMNGRQVADAITRRRPDISVLFISGYSDDPRTRAMLGEGCDFFRKPFTAEALRKKVRQVLDRRAEPAVPAGALIPFPHSSDGDNK